MNQQSFINQPASFIDQTGNTQEAQTSHGRHINKGSYS